MLTSPRILPLIAAVVASGCATSDVAESEYDEVARIMAAAITTPEGGGDLGAFTMSARLARGELPMGFERLASSVIEGQRGEFVHRYFVVCTDAGGALVDGCGRATERALVLASWAGPLATAQHEGILRRGGFWTVHDPWHATAMIAGDTWLELAAGTYRVDDYRDVLLVVPTDPAAVTAGSMTADITLADGPARFDIHGDIELTFQTATITLDGVHEVTVELNHLIR